MRYGITMSVIDEDNKVMATFNGRITDLNTKIENVTDVLLLVESFRRKISPLDQLAGYEDLPDHARERLIQVSANVQIATQDLDMLAMELEETLERVYEERDEWEASK